MEVVLYNNLSESIVISKRIEELTSMNCKVQDGCSILNPVLILKNNENTLTTNYCYIPNFNRYYYITDNTILDGNRCMLTCQVDVLMSHKDKILNTKQSITRQQVLYNMYLADESLQVTTKPSVQTRNFTPPVGGWIINNSIISEQDCYVLNTL